MIESIPVIGNQLQQLLLGSASVGQTALIRFYTLHMLVLPLALIFMFGVHSHKVVRQGISKPPSVDAGEREDKERVAFLPDVFVRESMWVMSRSSRSELSTTKASAGGSDPTSWSLFR
jgi:quinol-cytochrome oxidoreductase complex cytochrome b subunit